MPTPTNIPAEVRASAERAVKLLGEPMPLHDKIAMMFDLRGTRELATQLARYLLSLADADDGTAVDEAWLRSVGFTEREYWNGLWLENFRWLTHATTYGASFTLGECKLKDATNATRGDVRALCKVLGIPLLTEQKR